MLPLLLAFACDFGWEDSTFGAGADDSGSVVHGDCDPAVTVPWGTQGEQGTPIPADPHRDSFGAAPDPRFVRIQWPSRDPSRSVAFLWQADVDTMSSVVEIWPSAEDPAKALRVEGYTFLFGGIDIGTGPYRQHEVRLCGQLQPGTAYSYRVGGEGHWSSTYSFTTPAAPGSFDSFRVAIVGDSRGDYGTWAQVLSAIDGHAPDMILFSGDAIELGANQTEWEAWFEAAGDVLVRRPLVMAHGNHEFLAQHYYAHVAQPGNEEWFAIDYGPLLILALNDTVRSEDEIDSTQKAFIEQELAATTAPWRIAMHHQPAYSTCTTHGSDLDVRAAWSPALENGGVQLVTAGHNHIYERSVPIRDGEEQADGAGTVYMVSGGAGAPLYEENEVEWFGAVANPIEHYVIADYGPDAAEFVVRDLDGNVIDQFTIERW